MTEYWAWLAAADALHGNPLFIRILQATPFLAVAAFFAYEGVAIITGLVPTISRIMAYNLDIHPPVVAAVEGFIAGIVVVTLAFHFAGALSWWRP